MGNVVQLCKFIECVKHLKHWICQVQMAENCGSCELDKSSMVFAHPAHHIMPH